MNDIYKYSIQSTLKERFYYCFRKIFNVIFRLQQSRGNIVAQK